MMLFWHNVHQLKLFWTCMPVEKFIHVSHVKLILWGKLLKFIGLSLEILWNQTWLKTFSE